MNEEKVVETIATTTEETPVQQQPVLTVNDSTENTNAEVNVKSDGEHVDTTVNQHTSTPVQTTRPSQGLTHTSHQIHSPRSWNFFSGEDVKAAAGDASNDGPKSPAYNTGEKVTIDQTPGIANIASKATAQTADELNSVLGETTDPRELFNLMFGEIPDTYRRQQRDVRRESTGKRKEKFPLAEQLLFPVAADPVPVEQPDLREALIERREREFDRREREIDRRERDLERRERELDRRQREFDFDKMRISAEPRQYNIPQRHLQEMMDVLKKQIQADLAAERQRIAGREAVFEAKVMKRVNDVLESERQLYGVMKMSDHEVNEMMESSVGYLMHNDEDIADRVRFQSLIYLTQERLASEAGLQLPLGSDSFSLAWRLALGSSVATEERYNKALELLKDRDLQETTKKVMECKRAMEYAVEYTSHLRKEGTEMGDHSFSLGRISQKDYMESVERYSKGNAVEYEALKILVDFICPEL